ncbi:carbohydrate porin [Mucilaginibacter pallidiroseus]|uniref:Carbohydrate porin n=1 Tax=Mucilaginibacter pallidiroseus TaxID=2599295 RepID=A0A563UGP2_9SPHI|nr:carbohydrate porin [Mucilaginibacter pallidiroseus]TWR30560.1 carbohydrate porin [Mucilaginibacter pallidiroseus]
MNKPLFVLVTLLCTASFVRAQDSAAKQQNFNYHFQQTVITQFKPGFSAPYTGANSLTTGKETQSSLTTTFFGGARLWKGAEAYFNPELSGGSGLSKTLGIAGFPNGETFRVGAAEPKIYIARLYFTQNFEWGDDKEYQADDVNQLAGLRSKRYFKVTVGKFGMADFFDGNEFSHDARSQFMNWALMDNAAWDYPANTRGYVMGVMAELGQPTWALRAAFTMTTTTANGAIWDERIGRANTMTLEYEKRYQLNGYNGTVRLLGFRNNGKMGRYREAIAANLTAPVIDTNLTYGKHKYGFGVSADQYLTKNFGVFAKASWNDGHTETWAFTEIDRSVSLGAVLKGASWRREDDELGLAFVGNGISGPHRDYLAAGGYGFIIGDGRLNYATEFITEVYYKVNAYQKKLWLSPDYQFIVNPAYNKDRGPVNVFSLRAHVEF